MTHHITNYQSREASREFYIAWIERAEREYFGRETPSELIPWSTEKKPRRLSEAQKIRDSI